MNSCLTCKYFYLYRHPEKICMVSELLTHICLDADLSKEQVAAIMEAGSKCEMYTDKPGIADIPSAEIKDKLKTMVKHYIKENIMLSKK